ADAAVDAPDRQLDAAGFHRLPPGEHVLVDAIDERAVEIEQECRRSRRPVPHATSSCWPARCTMSHFPTVVVPEECMHGTVTFDLDALAERWWAIALRGVVSI